MASGFFITGTDTNVGKTWASVALMRALQKQGKVVVGMKPVAAGCEWDQGGWKNQDALYLQKYASKAVDYRHVNPYAFEHPVSPHIACGDVDVRLDLIQREFEHLQRVSECVVVEGAGGWFSPLGCDLNNADLAKALRLPVILVVGMRLGCINHALLASLAIRQARLSFAGWLAVQIDGDMQGLQANLDYLLDRMMAPCLGVLPHLVKPDFDLLANCVKLQN